MGFLRNIKKAMAPAYYTMQGAETVDITVAAAALAVPGPWTVTDRDGNETPAKAVRCSGTCAGGNLEVHLIGNPTGVFTVLDFAAGDQEGIVFDIINNANTTLVLNSTVEIFV